jgi:hypothetical protein
MTLIVTLISIFLILISITTRQAVGAAHCAAYCDEHLGIANRSVRVTASPVIPGRLAVTRNLDMDVLAVASVTVTFRLPDGAVTETAAGTSSHERLKRADPSLFHRENFHAARRHVLRVNGLLDVATVPGQLQVVQLEGPMKVNLNRRAVPPAQPRLFKFAGARRGSDAGMGSESAGTRTDVGRDSDGCRPGPARPGG